jgi:hypothetical protein
MKPRSISNQFQDWGGKILAIFFKNCWESVLFRDWGGKILTIFFKNCWEAVLFRDWRWKILAKFFKTGKTGIILINRIFNCKKLLLCYKNDTNQYLLK